MASSITQAPSASNTTEIAATPADRSKVFRLVAQGVDKGLPVPLATYLYHHQSMVLRFDDNEIDAVNAWAGRLGLPVPAANPHVYDLDSKRPWKSYEAGSFTALPGATGWTAHVWCVVAATESEIAAALVKATAADLAEVTR